MKAKDVLPPKEELVPIAPSFTCPNGNVINSTDSLDDDLRLYITMLEALCLPKDLKKLPYSAEKNMA